MNHVAVKSSNIKSVAYDPASRRLQVAMSHGKTYEYQGVPPEVHQAYMAAPSPGQFHAENIRGKYQHMVV